MRAIFCCEWGRRASGAKRVDKLANKLHMFGAQTGYIQRLRRLNAQKVVRGNAEERGDAMSMS